MQLTSNLWQKNIKIKKFEDFNLQLMMMKNFHYNSVKNERKSADLCACDKIHNQDYQPSINTPSASFKRMVYIHILFFEFRLTVTAVSKSS